MSTEEAATDATDAALMTSIAEMGRGAAAEAAIDAGVTSAAAEAAGDDAAPERVLAAPSPGDFLASEVLSCLLYDGALVKKEHVRAAKSLAATSKAWAAVDDAVRATLRKEVEAGGWGPFLVSVESTSPNARFRVSFWNAEHQDLGAFAVHDPVLMSCVLMRGVTGGRAPYDVLEYVKGNPVLWLSSTESKVIMSSIVILRNIAKSKICTNGGQESVDNGNMLKNKLPGIASYLWNSQERILTMEKNATSIIQCISRDKQNLRQAIFDCETLFEELSFLNGTNVCAIKDIIHSLSAIYEEKGRDVRKSEVTPEVKKRIEKSCFSFEEFRTMATEAVQKKRKIRESDAKILKDDLERCENL